MKKICGIILVFIVVSIVPAFAINVTQRWDRTYNISGFTLTYSIQQTSDGGYILAGCTPGSSGYDDFLVLKLDYNGDIIWQKAYGGDEGDISLSIQQTFDGGYIVAGWSFSFPPGILALKLDSSGNIAWQTSYATSIEPHPHCVDAIFNGSIIQTQDSGFIMTGGLDGGCSYDDALVVIKLNADGYISWQKQYPTLFTGSTEDIYPIRQTSDGGYVIGAGRDGDLLLLKLDADGDSTWQKTYGGQDFEGRPFIEETSDGGFILAGSTFSFGAGIDDFWLLKLNSSGDVIWQKTYGGESWETPSSVKQTWDGGYIVAGSASSFGTEDSLWILKLNGAGDITWQKIYLERRAGYSPTVATTSDGGYIISSASSTPPSYDWKVWVLKLDSNGEIPDCSVLSTTDVMAVDTFVTGIDSDVSSSPVSLIAYSQSMIPQNVSSDISTICQYEDPLDSDGDGVKSNPGGFMAGNMLSGSFLADGDNCSDMPNGQYLGTCTSGKVGSTCIAHAACGINGFCSMNQEDTLPPLGNGIGDACECEGNFNCSADQDVDGSDAALFKGDFGRGDFESPCISTDTCNGDFSCDGDVDGTDAALFKQDFGSSQFSNPCPTCTQGVPWCVYP